MKINQLKESTVDLTLLHEHLLYNNPILIEAYQGLTAEQHGIVEGVYRSFLPLIEATLTADQVRSLFGNLETELAATGKNKTVIGKGIDAARAGVGYAKQVNDAINKFGSWLQDTAPVKFADEKFEQLRKKIAAKYPKLNSSLDSLGNWMKENPGKSAAVIGLMTVLASLGGGPAGGAIAGQILRGAAELVKGERLSTALGKSIKTAAYGAMAGWALEGIGNWLEGWRVSAVPYERVPGLTQISINLEREITGPGIRLVDSLGSIVVPQERAQEFIQLANQARSGSTTAFSELWNFTRTFNVRDALANINASQAEIKAIAIANDQFLSNLKMANDAVVALAQGSIAGKIAPADVKVDGKPLNAAPTKEARSISSFSLTETQLKLLFDYTAKINEGPFDNIVKAVGRGLSKLSTKFTADQLYQAWEKAGSPTDSEDVKIFLIRKGIDKKLVDKIWQDAGIDDAKAKAVDNATATSNSTKSSDEPFAFDLKDIDKFNSQANKITGVIFTPGSDLHAALSPNQDFKENLENFIVNIVGEVKDKYVSMPTDRLKKIANSNLIPDIVNRNEVQAALVGHLDLNKFPPEFRTNISIAAAGVEEAFDRLFLIWLRLAVKERDLTGNKNSTEAYFLLSSWAKKSLSIVDRIRVSVPAPKGKKK